MAKQLNYKKTITESITVKGILSDDAKTITYLDEDKDDVTIEVQTLLDKFASQGVALSIKMQNDEELELDSDVE